MAGEMMSTNRSHLHVAALLVAVTLAVVSPVRVEARVLSEDVMVAELDNGIRVVVSPAHDVPVVSVVAVVRGGSSVEGRDQRGLAHIVEHMVFQGPIEGTPTGMLPQTIEALGGEIRAETSADASRYIATIAPDGAAEAIAALGFALSAPVFDAQRLRTELDIMEKELDEVYASPIVALRNTATQAIYGDGPYAQSAGGGPEALPQYTIHDVAAFHQTHYVGANMAVIVAGDMDGQEAVDAVSEAFADIPLGAPTVPSLSADPATPVDTITAPHGAPLVGLFFVAPGISAMRDVLATDVLLGILDHGSASRMRTQLPRALPGVGGLGAGFLTQRLPGHLYLWVDPGQASPQAAIGVLKTILADIRDNGVSVEECQQGARTALLLHAMGADTYTGQAESLAFYEAIDSYELAISYEDEVLTIGPDDIRRVVLRYFDPDRALVVIGGGAP